MLQNESTADDFRLKPEEVDLMLRLHAEQEHVAPGQDAMIGAPTLSEIAELLGVERQDAVQLLARARQELAMPPAFQVEAAARATHDPSQETRRRLLTLGAAAAVAIALLCGVAIVKPGSTRVATILPAQQITVLAPASDVSVIPPPGFEVKVEEKNGENGSQIELGALKGSSSERPELIPKMSADEANAVRHTIAATMASLLDREGAWVEIHKLGASVRMQGGKWVQINPDVPELWQPFQRENEAVQKALTEALEKHWSEITKRSSN